MSDRQAETTPEQLRRTIRFAREDYTFFRQQAYTARVMGEPDLAWERGAADSELAWMEAQAELDRLEQ